MRNISIENSRRVFFCAVFLISLASLLVFPFGSARSQEVIKKHVLILNSYHPGFVWSDNVVEGISSVLEEELRETDVHIEYMDTKRIVDNEHIENLARLYRHKFKNVKFDLIISSDDNAFRFLLQHRNKFFPEVPYIFCGVNNFSDSMLKGQEKIAGIVEDVEFAENFNLMMKLQPGLKHIFVVGSNYGYTGAALTNKIKEIVPLFKGHPAFTVFENYDIGELEQKLRTLGRDTAVFSLCLIVDKAGKFYSYNKSVELVVKNSSVPVYSSWEFTLGEGVIGGKMVDSYDHGKEAGEMALKVLAGKMSWDVPEVRKSRTKYMFDYEQLQRFKVKRSALPENSIIINRSLPFYSIHKEVMWAVIAIIAVLMLSVFGLLLNTVKRKRAENALIESERNLKEAQEIGKIASWMVDVPSQKGYWSDEFFHLLGYEVGEVDSTYEQFLSHVHPDDRELIEKSYGEALGNLKPLDVEFRFFRKDGVLRFAHSKANVERNKLQKPRRVIGTLHDITERKEAEEKIKASLQEKELLLREIHHRVKNNMQIISSILLLQSTFIKDEEVIEIFRQSQNRIKSMALIHDKLYQTENLANVDFKEYTEVLIQYLSDFYKRDENNIAFNINVNDIFLDIDTAVPLGLIINELLTNAFKHAFEDGKQGEVSVSIREAGQEQLELIVSDNGSGLPENVDLENPERLGLQIVVLLVEKRLHGKIELKRNGGTEFQILVKKVKNKKE